MNVEWVLTRDRRLAHDTTGQLRDENGVLLCLILEDVVRDGPKVYGKTAIPFGRYRVTIARSPRFQRELPLLNAVPNFAGILIHPGNTANDTEGCLLPGLARRTLDDGTQYVSRSREAFDEIMPKIRSIVGRGDSLWINITR